LLQPFPFHFQESVNLLSKLHKFLRVLLNGRLLAQFPPPLARFTLHKVSTSYPGIYHKNTPSPMAKTCAGRGFEVPIAPTQLSAGSFVFSRFECHARNATPSKGFQGAVRLGVALCFCGL